MLLRKEALKWCFKYQKHLGFCKGLNRAYDFLLEATTLPILVVRIQVLRLVKRPTDVYAFILKSITYNKSRDMAWQPE